MRTFRILLLLIAAPAMGLSNRVFVGSTGVDMGACPITAPCRSFSYAMSQVAAGGEVIALDTAGYGIFVINQGVTVFAAPGATAFVAVPSNIGIIVEAADSVVLRNIAVSGTGGTAGIAFNGQSLSIENCIISGFNGPGDIGVSMAPSVNANDSKMHIDGSTIRNNDIGIFSQIYGQGLVVTLTISRSTVSENGWGLDVSDNTRGAATDTVFSGNHTVGVLSWTANDGAGPDFTLERCTIAQNETGISAGYGSQVGGPTHGTVRIAHNQIFGNNVGLFHPADGRILSLVSNTILTNTIEGNLTDGTTTGTYTAK